MPQVLTTDAPEGTRYELRSTNQENVLLSSANASTLAAAPLSTVFFVDAAAPAGGNGSIGKPFNTLQAGVDAIALLSPASGTLEIVPGNFSLQPDVLIPDNTALTLVGMGRAQLPALDWGASATDLTLDNVDVELVGTDPLTVTASDCSIQNTGGAAGFILDHCQFEGPNVAELDATESDFIGGLVASVGGHLRFVNECTFSGGLLSGPIAWDRPSEFNAKTAGCTIDQAPTSTDGIAESRYGTGDSGALLVSGTVVTDGTTEYSEVQITNGVWGGGGTGGRQFLFVRDLLDLSAVAIGAGIVDEPAGLTGANAAGAVGGAGAGGPAGLPDQAGGTLGSTTGSNGVAGAGATPAALGGGFRHVNGGRGGASGAGGTSGGNAGGVGGAQAGGNQVPMTHASRLVMAGPEANGSGPATFWGGTPGRAGSSGGGDGTNLGGGGGAGAGGGGLMVIFARCIKVSGSTPAGVIESRAGAGTGGNGGNAAAGNAAGGGGGGGSGGGGILIFYEWIIGTQPGGPLIRANGGKGGNGGNALGTGTGGQGGGGGNGGVIQQFNTLTQKRNRAIGSGGTAGTGPAGINGGLGGAGGSAIANFFLA